MSANLALLDHEYLQKFGAYTRLYYLDRSYTNLEELKYAAALAGVLQAHGVAPGDRVLVMLPNMPELPALFQAIWTLGAAAVPIMPQWTALEAGHVLHDCGATVAVTVPPLAPRLHEASRESGALKHLLVFGESDAPGGENIVPQLAGAAPVETPVDRAPEDLAVLLYTSGTTGLPKGSVLSHGNVGFAIDTFYRQNPAMIRGPILQVLPFSHSFGLISLRFANRSGFSNVLLPQFDPVKVFQAIERHQVLYIGLVPTMLVYLLNHPDRGQSNLSSLRRITSGGAALPERLRASAAEAFGCRVDQGYGLSETFAVAATYQETAEYRPGSVGTATPGVDLRIVDDKGRVQPALHVGEICISSPHVAQGYWNDPGATRASFIEGWFHTRDVGYRDEDGYLFITDRKKDLIIKGGENISPREMEEVLYAHPSVAEAAVLGIPDAIYGEDIWAFVQLRPGIEPDEELLRRHVASFVSKFKVPAHIIFQPVLPKTAIGKISKRQIRERLATDLMMATSSTSF